MSIGNYKVTGKIIEWEVAKSRQAIPDIIGEHGFYIAYEPNDDPEKPYQAAWGEGDQESFATLEEAKAWCQSELDHFISEYAVVEKVDT